LRAVQERSFSDIYLEEREPDPGAEVGPIDPREYGETDDAVDDVAADRNGEVEDQAL
jgi:hypothetical protein